MRAIGSVHLHEGTGINGLVVRVVDDLVVHGQIRHEVALAVAELSALLVGVNVGFQVEGSVGSLQAHTGRFHIDRLEVHGVDGQSVNILIGVLLVDLDLFEAGIGAVVSAGIAGAVGGVRSGGVGLGVGCGIVGVAACGQGESHGAGQQDAEQGGDLLILHCVLFLFFGSSRNVGNLWKSLNLYL